MTPAACPAPDQLRDFFGGRIADDAASTVADHLDQCAVCRETIAGISQTSDPLLAALREPLTASPYAQEADYRRALQFVEAIGRSVSGDEVTTGPEKLAAATVAGPLPSARAESNAAATPAAEPVPRQRLRDYELLEKLGQGGMGAVYKARHVRLKKIVAIKVLPNDRLADPGAVARFEREMEAVGKLDHPNIVRAMDAGEVDGVHFLVMEYVAGSDLSQLAREHGRLPIREACELIRQAAVGLQAAHEHGMVHRDIKPSNLMLAVVQGSGMRSQDSADRRQATADRGRGTESRHQPVVKILDMGLALLSEAHSPDARNLTSTGQMMGTIDYMAPEQGGDSHQVDIRADLYSLGATLYKLLTGEAPFSGEKYDTPVKKLMALATKSPPPVRSRRPEIPGALASLVDNLLAKDPDDRLETPEDVAEALAPFAAGADLQALASNQPSSAGERGEGRAGGRDEAVGNRLGSQIGAPATVDRPAAALAALPPTLDLPPRISLSEDHSPRPQKSAGGRIPRWAFIAGAWGGAGLAALFGILFFIQTGDGVIEVKINDPEIKVLVDHDGNAIFQGTDKKHAVELKPGPHGFTIKRGDFAFKTTDFQLSKRGKIYLSVKYSPGKIQLADSTTNKVIEEWQLPPAPERAVATQGSWLEFDGVDDSVTVPTLRFDGSHPLTMEAWVQVAPDQPKSKQDQTVFGWEGVAKVIVANDRLQSIGFKPGHNLKAVRVSPEGVSQLPGWRHVAFVWNGSGMQQFVDGASREPPAELTAMKNSFAENGPQDHFALGCNVEFTKGAERKKYAYFKGKLAEIRISRVARYEAPFKPEAHFSADSDTLALYQFDEGAGEILRDSSGNKHDGKILGAQWETVGAVATGHELSLTPSDRVEIPSLKIDRADTYTFEGFFTPAVDKPGIPATTIGSGFHGLGLEAGGHWQFGWVTDEFHAAGWTPCVAGQRTHVAGVHLPDKLLLFIDGKLVFDHPVTASTSEVIQLNLGGGFTGQLDEMRVSRGARYTKDFPPLQAHTRFQPDEQTVALYHFDEGLGDVLQDSSGNNHHGKIVGAKWVQMQERGVQSPTVVTEAPRFALDFSSSRPDEHPHVELPKVFNSRDPFTAEMFVTQRAENPARTNRLVFQIGGGCLLQMWGRGEVDFSGPEPIGNGDRKLHVVGTLAIGKRTHLAAVSNGKEVSLFVDGRRIGSAPQLEELLQATSKDGLLGGRKNHSPNWSAFQGTIDGFRYSKAVRYEQSFTPPRSFSADQDTLILYNFQEGQGDVLTDSSGNGHHGKIVGAKWVRANAISSVGPIDLLQDVDFEKFNSTKMHWERNGTRLVGRGVSKETKGEFTWHIFPTEISGDYDLEFDFEQQGFWPLQVDLPLGDRAVRIDLTPEGSGLMVIDGKERMKLAPPYRNDAAKLRNGHLHKLVAKVRNQGDDLSLDVKLDGVSVGQFSGDRKRVSLDWIKPNKTQVKFTAMGNLSKVEMEIRRAVVTPRTEQQPPPTAAPGEQPLDNGNASIDLLPKIDLDGFGAPNMRWERTANGLSGRGIAKESKGQWVGHTFPDDIGTNYDLEFDFEQQGFWPLQIHLPLGDRAVCIDLSPDGSGIFLIDGKERQQQVPPQRNDNAKLRTGVPHKLVAKVRNQGDDVSLDIKLDGENVAQFSGERKRISLPHWVVPDKKRIRLSSLGNLSNVQMQIRRAVVTPVAASPATEAPSPAVATFDAAQAKAHQEAWAKHLGVPEEYTDHRAAEWVLSIGDGEHTRIVVSEDGQERESRELPSGPFQLTGVHLIHNQKVTDAGLANLKDCQNLTLLNLGYTNIGDAGVAHFKGCTKLKTLLLPGRVTDAGLANFKDCKDLATLSLHGLKLSNAGLSHFSHCEDLTSLGVRSCPLGDVTLAHFKDCKKLTYLDLADSRVPPQELSHFRGCTNLKHLDLGAVKVSDAVIEELLAFPELTWLNLADTNLTDAGLARLNECRQLTHLRLVKANVSQGAVEAFHKAMPQCRIEWDGGTFEPKQVPRSAAQSKTAPPPAIAPFDAAQAKAHQEAWAKYLGLPVSKDIDLGDGLQITMVLIPPGEFLMGSSDEERYRWIKAAMTANDQWAVDNIPAEGPQHRVRLTKPFYLSKHEVTQGQYQRVKGMNPSHFSASGVGKDVVAGQSTDRHPVERVSWDDAIEFCNTLSAMQKRGPAYEKSGISVSRLASNGFRLPSEAEWEFACRAGSIGEYSAENESELGRYAWYAVNSEGATHPVGDKLPNGFGLHDMHGNVWEWCWDWFDPKYYRTVGDGSYTVEPFGPAAGAHRVNRGGVWAHPAWRCRSAHRSTHPPDSRINDLGFRVAVSIDAFMPPADAPPPAIAPFDAAQAKAHQAAWAKHLGVPVEHENSIGMKFRLIPPGEFLLGATQEEIEEGLETVKTDSNYDPDRIRASGPQHRVLLSQPMYLAAHEVTQAQFEAVVGSNPSAYAKTGSIAEKVALVEGLNTAAHPVDSVSWNDAAAFCAKLSEREKLQPCYLRAGDAVTDLPGNGYRLPCEAMWEFACRAGTASRYWDGESAEDLARVGWYGKNSGLRTHPVGELPANPFGLFDMHGNVMEWCQDWWDAKRYGMGIGEVVRDPTGPATGTRRTTRGGGWGNFDCVCRSATRYDIEPAHRAAIIGFRVALPVEAVRLLRDSVSSPAQ